MQKSRFAEPEVGAVLKEAESGVPVTDVVRKAGITRATFFAYRSKRLSVSRPPSGECLHRVERVAPCFESPYDLRVCQQQTSNSPRRRRNSRRCAASREAARGRGSPQSARRTTAAVWRARRGALATARRPGDAPRWPRNCGPDPSLREEARCGGQKQAGHDSKKKPRNGAS